MRQPQVDLLLLLFCLASSGTWAASFVPVEHPGNPVDAVSHCGAVGYPYAIGRYEVTNGEYAAFLNSVARDSDPFSLYTPLMAQHFWGGIVRTKTASGYTYLAKQGYVNKPVTFVSWTDAARYANWLHYGAPDTGRSQLGTTEGSATEGAYDTRKTQSGKPTSRRNSAARFFLPNCNEWIKAGFYDPATKSYNKYAYPGLIPAAGSPVLRPEGANFSAGKWAAPFPHLTDVGSYKVARSRLGTYDQAGNVMEWAEDDFGMSKAVLGGSLFMGAQATERGYKDSESAAEKLSSFGFRIATRIEERGTTLPVSSREAPYGGRSAGIADNGERDSAYIRITHPRNPFDWRSGKGCVAYEYEMQEAEVSNREWADFLNVVASHADDFLLFHPDMQRGVGGGIERIRIGSRYSYRVKEGMGGRPVNYLSWFSLARYANWQHYGRPQHSAGPGSTEGDATHGAYDTRGFASFDGISVVAPQLFRRNPSARYFIPNDDEWFKAAYFDPDKPGLLKYHRYPNRSDRAPGNLPGEAGSANYQVETTLGEGAPHYLASSHAYGLHGAYGLRNLGGNLWEWVEDWASVGGLKCWRCNYPVKGLRGGSFNYVKLGLDARNLDPGDPRESYFVYGGRLARRPLESNNVGFEACGNDTLRKASVRLYGYVTDSRVWVMGAGTSVLLAVVCLFLRWRQRRR